MLLRELAAPLSIFLISIYASGVCYAEKTAWKCAEESGYPAHTFLASRHLGTKLYLSEMTGKRPLVVVLHGSDGGTNFMEGMSPYLLEAGFHVLGITYFDKSPSFRGQTQLKQIRLESFLEEVDAYLEVHSDVIDENKIALFGASFGGHYSLLLASLYPRFRAVIAFTPSDIVFQRPWLPSCSTSTLLGEDTPYVSMPIFSWASYKCVKSYFYDFRGPKSVSCDEMFSEAMLRPENLEEATVKVEKINGPLVVISAKRDNYWPSFSMSNRVSQRLIANGFVHPHHHLSVPGLHDEYYPADPKIIRTLDLMFEYLETGNRQLYEEKFSALFPAEETPLPFRPAIVDSLCTREIN